MIDILQQTNFFLALGGIGFAFLTLGLFIDFKTAQLLKPLIQKWGLLVASVVTLFSIILTLIYSEVFGIIPCGLCWLERIALYPQIILLLVAMCFKDTLMPRYGIALSVFGLIVALYHHFIQMGGTQFIKCPVAGAGVDCAKRFLFEFDFVTFPLLAGGLFLFLIVLYIYILKVRSA
jgi:disulfide bond formation protein DsbB